MALGRSAPMLTSASPGRGGDGAGAGRAQRATGSSPTIANSAAPTVVEYDLPPLTFPYRAQVDNNGALWTGGMSTDRVVSLDPKTGTAVEYPMPSGTNMRTAYVDNSTTPVTFWVGSNHAHALVKVEPLD